MAQERRVVSVVGGVVVVLTTDKERSLVMPKRTADPSIAYERNG